MKMSDVSAWEVDAGQFPHQGSFAEKMHFALRYATLPPSFFTAQDWRFEIRENSLSIQVDGLPALLAKDGENREFIIGCGAALMNLRVALAYFSCQVEIHTCGLYSIQPNEIAQIRPTSNANLNADLALLFPEVSRHLLNCDAYSPGYLSHSLYAQLIAAAIKECTFLKVIESDIQRKKVAELVIASDFLQFHEPSFRRELVNWIHNKRSLDGMLPYALGVQTRFDLSAPIMKWVMRIFDVPYEISAAHQELLQNSPEFVCLSTRTDDVKGWLSAGQALQRILLIAASTGLGALLFHRAIEIDILRDRLREIMKLHSYPYPQVLLRLSAPAKQADASNFSQATVQ